MLVVYGVSHYFSFIVMVFIRVFKTVAKLNFMEYKNVYFSRIFSIDFSWLLTCSLAWLFDFKLCLPTTSSRLTRQYISRLSRCHYSPRCSFQTLLLSEV